MQTVAGGACRSLSPSFYIRSPWAYPYFLSVRSGARRWAAPLVVAGVSGGIGTICSGRCVRFVGRGADHLAENDFFDVALGVLEVLLLVPLVVFSIGCLACIVAVVPQKLAQFLLNKKILLWQNLLLSFALLMGRISRRRQWRRINRTDQNGATVGLVGRIERVEGETRAMATVLRTLSRHLEKLGVRLKVTKNAMKVPIAEAAALAQLNSEATRALALKADVLEKETRELQRVLLAMQDQQQKQLELILAIVKALRSIDAVAPSSDNTHKSTNHLDGKHVVSNT